MTDDKKPGGAGGRGPGSKANCKSKFTADTAAVQRARILEELKHRPLTTLQARRDLDILHPAGRVRELRLGGYLIASTWTYDVTTEGYLHRVARYQLIGERAQRDLF